MLFRGRWGLYDYDFATETARRIHRQAAFRPSEIVKYSYDRDGRSAVCLRCSDEDPDVNGVYSYPADGSEPVRLTSDSFCSPLLMNYFQKRRRGVDPVPARKPRTQRPVSVDGFPGTIHAIRQGSSAGVAVWGNGAAESDTLCLDCRAAFVSWPSSGGRTLVATSPEDIYDLVSPGDLWLLDAGEEPLPIARAQFETIAWRDTARAVVLARPGVPWGVDLDARTARPLNLSAVPDWLRLKPLPAASIWTIRAPRALFAEPDSARAASLALRPLDIHGYALDDAPGGGLILSVGAFADSAAAAAALGRLHTGAPEFPAAGATIARRPAAGMLGSFDFGHLTSPDGRRTAFLRSHPHMFQPYSASEIWVDPGGGGRRRLLLEAMASW